MKNFAYISIILMFIISCNDWLELEPPQGLTRNEFWQSKEDVQAAVMGAYDAFARMDGKLFKYGELRADLIKGGNNQPDNERKIAEGNIYPDNELCRWLDFYKIINYCNEVIKFGPEVRSRDKTFSDFLLRSYLAEAYFLRGLSYFYLVRIFKDVPYITEPTYSDEVDVYKPKSNGDSILLQVINDLKMVREWATIDGYKTNKENKGRATKAAIDALLADINLWLFRYEECIKYIENIEKLIKYELMPTGLWLELFYPGAAVETIFEFSYSDMLGEKNSMFGLTGRYSYQYYPSQKSLELFAIDYNSREFTRGEDGSIKKYSKTEYVIWKYIGRIDKTERSGSDQNSAPFIIYRLADIYLMKAEALSQLGRYDEALRYINIVRERAKMPVLNLPESKIVFEDAIIEERAREFAFEGKRWFDLLRMGRRDNYNRKNTLIEILVKNVPATQKRIMTIRLSNPLGWYLPIHKDEIERNPNLIQNPFYKD